MKSFFNFSYQLHHNASGKRGVDLSLQVEEMQGSPMCLSWNHQSNHLTAFSWVHISTRDTSLIELALQKTMQTMSDLK
jgi:hypothetical protein